jgi:hypothetical protein
VRADLADGRLTVVLGADGHLHPKAEEPAVEAPAERVDDAAEQHPPVDPADPEVAANRARLEELRHARVGAPADREDAVATVARPLVFAVYKVPMWLGERVLRLFDRR